MIRMTTTMKLFFSGMIKNGRKKVALEMRDALCKIRGWHLKKNDEWLRDMLVEVVSDNLRYETLPSRETQGC